VWRGVVKATLVPAVRGGSQDDLLPFYHRSR
jgi:hypothetical protein